YCGRGDGGVANVTRMGDGAAAGALDLGDERFEIGRGARDAGHADAGTPQGQGNGAADAPTGARGASRPTAAWTPATRRTPTPRARRGWRVRAASRQRKPRWERGVSLRQFFPRPRSKLIASESSSREAVRTPGEARRANDGDLGPW